MKYIPVIYDQPIMEGYQQKKYCMKNGRKYEMVPEPGDEEKEQEQGQKAYILMENGIVHCMTCGASFIAYNSNGEEVRSFCPGCGVKLE